MFLDESASGKMYAGLPHIVGTLVTRNLQYFVIGRRDKACSVYCLDSGAHAGGTYISR